MEMFILSLQVYPGVELKVTPVRGCGGRCATEHCVELKVTPARGCGGRCATDHGEVELTMMVS
jgi:hypothetical protein